jgi:hypothetical protein
MTLSQTERATLEVLADRARTGDIPRGHLEKFSRLDLIEPCPEGVCMTLKGRKALSGR